MQRFATASLIAAVASTLLYYLSFALGLGFLFLFLPTLPLFWLGLSRQDSSCLHASLIAAVILALLASPASALFYLFFLALPSSYIAHESLKHGQFAPTITLWYPLSVIFSKLTTVLCFVILAITLFYGNSEGGVPAMVAQQISMTFATVFKDVPPDETLIMKSAAERYSFLVFSITGWMWALSLYLHGWVMNRELTRRKKNLRPNLAISIFPPPNWMLSLLFIAAVASTIGGPSLAFWGKSSLILLMLPYFLLGMALIHEQSKKLPNRKIILIFLYVMLFSLLWVVLLVAGYGFYYHVKLLNKYLSAGGTSSRS